MLKTLRDDADLNFNLLKRWHQQKRQNDTELLALGALHLCESKQKFKVKMVTDPESPVVPPTHSTRPFATCDTSLWVRQSRLRRTSVSRFELRLPLLQGLKSSRTRSYGRNLLSEWVSSKMVMPFARRIKQRVRQCYPRRCGELHSPLGS